VPAGRDLVRRLERVWAADEVARTEALGRLDPSCAIETFPLADGWAVLSGRGHYVNRVLAAGLDGPVDPAQIDEFEARAGGLGVPPTFDICDICDVEFVAELNRRGYVETVSVTGAAMRLDAGAAVEPVPGVVVEVAGSARLTEWQEVNAHGWGQVEPPARRVSDLFAAARAAVGELLLIATDAGDGRPLGTASVLLTDGVATMGGMATLPAERRRGVQQALIAGRLVAAKAAGCDLLVSTARTDGDSLRNLVRLGFEPTHVKRLVSRA
jgi:GNAT superfamily N-acetyltransferase